MRAFVTGGLGFIGSHLVPRLHADGIEVTVYDRKHRGADMLDVDRVKDAMLSAAPDVVYHLAARADVSKALDEREIQIRQNFLATYHVLEAMKVAHVPRIVFTSSAVVYGNEGGSWGVPVNEYGIGQQTSIYGAMKLASEALIEAYCVGFGLRADIFRLVSLVGEGYRHGNLLDFYRRLKTDPTRLVFRGSTLQHKFYCVIDDFIDAVRLVDGRDHEGAQIWNVSASTPNTIHDSIDVVSRVLGVDPHLAPDGQPWVGDQPALVLDTTKLRKLGWSPKVPVIEGMRRTVEWFVSQHF